jgi:hypothetical protein
MIAGWDTGKFNLSRDMLDHGMEGMETQRVFNIKLALIWKIIHDEKIK